MILKEIDTNKWGMSNSDQDMNSIRACEMSQRLTSLLDGVSANSK